MCRTCAILTYDEVLEIIREIESDCLVSIVPERPLGEMRAYPKSLAPLIVAEFDTATQAPVRTAGALAARELSWGFEESWKQGVVFNTRIESAFKPTWRDSMLHRRCVIPVTSFFETHQQETRPSPKTGKPVKRPYEFQVPGQEVILIGCIWRGESFSMVTTDANDDMAPIHHRMPLVVRQDELETWFGPDFQRLADRGSVRLEARPAA